MARYGLWDGLLVLQVSAGLLWLRHPADERLVQIVMELGQSDLAAVKAIEADPRGADPIQGGSAAVAQFPWGMPMRAIAVRRGRMAPALFPDQLQLFLHGRCVRLDSNQWLGHEDN